MNTPDWLVNTQKKLFNLMQANNSPILIHGHQSKGLYHLVNNYLQQSLCEASINNKPCLKCLGCHLCISGNHPDLQFLMPQAVALELGFNLEVKNGVKPSQEIRIDEIRNLQNFFNTTSTRGASRFVVIYPFDQMNAHAANSLLKILEEPANDLRFILIGSRVDKLLPTIRSRCQQLSVNMPSISESLDWLETQGVIQQADIALSVSMNDPFEALNLVQNSIDQLNLRKTFLDWLANSEQSVIPPAGLEKLGIAVAIELAMRLCSDCVAHANGMEAIQFPWLEPKLNWVRRIHQKKFSLLYHNLQQEFRWATHPINPRLVLEHLGQQWQNLRV
jgi:DNA polymerase-3 subunit delta'